MVEGREARSRKQSKVPVTRICVLGPSFVGKTQIVNRLVNNNFYAQYEATEEVETYKLVQNRAAPGGQPDLVCIEILDCFPQDHPLLFRDAKGEESEAAKLMQESLKKIIENKPNEEPESADFGKKWIDAFIFVYDSGEPRSFQKLLKVIKSVHEFEQSHALGKKEDDREHHKVFKYVLGTKKDLKPHKKMLSDEDLADLQEFNTDDSISLQEVSALTAYGVGEVFQSILQEVVGHSAHADRLQLQLADEADVASQPYGDEAGEEGVPKGEDSYGEEEINQSASLAASALAGPSDGAGRARRESKSAAKANLNFMSRQLQQMDQQKRRHRDDTSEGRPATQASAPKRSRDKRERGRSKTPHDQDKGVAESILRTFVPFLFQEESSSTAKGKHKTRK